jgi:plasmid stability protein
MKTTLELPDELVKEIKLRAIHEGSKLKDAVADLLRKGLAAKATGSGKKATVVKADTAMLKRREEITRKFVSGEWGVELAAYDEGREADRKSAGALDKAWRK